VKQLSKKDIKRKQIAKSCCNIFASGNFHDIPISQIASTAGIGKGTIYEYFQNKEDIVFELMSCLQEDYDDKFHQNLSMAEDDYEKIIVLFDIFISSDKVTQIQREIYKQFLIVCLTKPSKEILNYNANLRAKYISVLDEILKNQSLSTKIYDTVIGFFIASSSLDGYDLEHTVKDYIKSKIYKENR